MTPLEFLRAELWRRTTRVPVGQLSYGVVCATLGLAILVDLRLVTERLTERQTHNDSIYRANIVSRGNNCQKCYLIAKIFILLHEIDVIAKQGL